jgi:hypothetical protein
MRSCKTTISQPNLSSVADSTIKHHFILTQPSVPQTAPNEATNA